MRIPRDFVLLVLSIEGRQFHLPLIRQRLSYVRDEFYLRLEFVAPAAPVINEYKIIIKSKIIKFPSKN